MEDQYTPQESEETPETPTPLYPAGLEQGDPAVIRQLFAELRSAVIRSIGLAGGTAADGAVFFQTAVMQTAELAREGNWPAGEPVSAVLPQLATAQYHSWLIERGRMEAAPAEQAAWIPDDAGLKAMRRKIFTWKKCATLDKADQKLLFDTPDAHELSLLRARLRNALLPPSGTPAPEQDLPEWAKAALHDRAGWELWEQVRQIEYRASEGMPLDGSTPQSGSGKVAGLIVAGLMLLLLGAAVWKWATMPKAVDKAVFDNNFDRPQSILEDILARDAKDTLGIIDHSRSCLAYIAIVDEAYKRGELKKARNQLFDLIEDPEVEPCLSDVCYYAGVVSLELEKPGDAINCFAKIDNIEHYGEDLYYHQALAFVKLAADNGQMRPLAQRSLERLLENTRDPQRRARAEEMLKQITE